MAISEDSVAIRVGAALLEASLAIPSNAESIVVFAHGSGSSRFSPRNTFVARVLHEHKFATLLTDLLTAEEDTVYENRFHIDLLTERLIRVVNWIKNRALTRHLQVGLFGASTGAASALGCAARLPDAVKAVVSRGGRPDLAGAVLNKVSAPTLLLVGRNDNIVLELNRQAYKRLRCVKQLRIIPGATHLFEEEGALEQVADYAGQWFLTFMAGDQSRVRTADAVTQ